MLRNGDVKKDQIFRHMQQVIKTPMKNQDEKYE
jgi:hypothetical protein